MRYLIGGLCRRAIGCGILAGAMVGVAGAARADSNTVFKSRPAESISTPMSDGANAAPYSVRFRITGFLARQHAQEGNVWRSLVEFYSMLNADDAAWPDDEVGDSFRIARDIEVAQMMTESGFFDHAIRVLQTSYILAYVNSDPQVGQVESQMQATADLAKLKGIPVPLVDMSFLREYEPVRQAVTATAPASRPADVATTGAEVAHPIGEEPIAEEPGPSLTGTPAPQAVRAPAVLPPQEVPAGQPNELPKKLEPIPATEPPPVEPTLEGSQAELTEPERSVFSWFNPSRWLSKKEVAPASLHEPAVPHRAGTSPAVSPTYCQGCSGLHGTGGNVLVRYNPRTGVTHKHLPGPAVASPMPSPYQKKFETLQPANRPHGIPVESLSPVEVDSAAEPQAIESKPTESGVLDPADQGSNTDVHNADSNLFAGSESKPAVRQTADVAGTPSLDSSKTLGETTAATAAHGSAASEKPASRRSNTQVGVAGDVPSPGIFAMHGKSTTLAALLRRTGERDGNAPKRARILRAVAIHDRQSGEISHDFYCQRINEVRTNTEMMDTPVYGQELVIIDGGGEKPVYLAVMPHFILQLPVERDSKMTADQIIDRLSVHWPNVREQNIGILRFEQMGSSAVSRVLPGDASAQASLSAGDVIYIDGVSLDRAKVMGAAESIAEMAGARIRKHQAPKGSSVSE